MRQVRVRMTYSPDGTMTAMLQECEGFDINGHVYWRDVRPLPVAPDGMVTMSQPEMIEQSFSTLKDYMQQYPRAEVSQAFQNAFSEGELEL